MSKGVRYHEDQDDDVIPLTPIETPTIRRMSTSPGPTPTVQVKVHPTTTTKSLSLPPPDTCRPTSRASNLRKRNIFDNFRTKKTRTDQPWIQKNIPYKVCHTFVRNPDNPNENACYCGAEPAEHEEGVTNDPSITQWNPDTHIRKHNGFCFGKIKFVEEDGTHQPDFVRVSDDMFDRKSGSFRVLELLETKWRLPKPNLIISVTGGAQDFQCPPELEKRFKRGLVKAAKSTQAWIFTGGTNTGVMKLVGEAVRGTSFGSQIITLGVATWGIIKNREQLISVRNPQGRLVRDYETKESRTRRGAFLDPNHTHFLLVDDGTQYQYGKEIQFRAKLEQKISERYKEGESTLPQICILVEGGPNSIKTLLETVKLGTPGLVIAGSGRSADVLAEAHLLSSPEEAINRDGEKIAIRVLSEANKEELCVVISKKFPNMLPKQKDEIQHQIIELLKYDKYLTIYELNDSKEFDLALLAALIRGNRHGTSSLASMKLAITWNRPNLADSMILPNARFTEQEKSDLLRIAIVQDKPVFIQMMLDQGLDMKYFLTQEILAGLYNEIDKTVVCYKKLRKISGNDANEKKVKLSLMHIGELMEEILEGTFQSEFTTMEFMKEQESSKHKYFENPYDMMVVYAVYVESQEMAKLFWERCKTPIATGLIASKINKYLAEVQRARLKRDEENEKKLLVWANDFEILATGVMNQCFKDRNHQKELWLEVLQIKHRSWGNLDLVRLASSTDAATFLSQGAVQTLLTDIWLGQIHAAQHWLKIAVAATIPIIGPLIIMRYTKLGAQSDTDDENSSFTEIAEQDKQVEMTNLENGAQAEAPVEVDGGQIPTEFTKKRKLRTLEKIVYFYNAPIIKFQYYVMMYIVFLGIFIYTLIFARPMNKASWVENKDSAPDWISGTRYSACEICLFFYVISTIPIEIFQIVEQTPKTFRMKLWRYIQDMFNILDVLGIFCFLAGFIIKSLGEPSFSVPVSGNLDLHNAHHLLMILSFLMYCIRLIQMFRINPNMGPKIIMIGKMMIDLFFFIFLMVIFLIGYGVCAQALMNPNQGLENTRHSKTNGSIVFDVIFRPYLHVFGELDLDGMNQELTAGHCDADKLADESCSINTVLKDVTGVAHYYLVMGLLGAYLLFVNILLINLLIAIFSKSYEDIQSESDIVWKVQRSDMIQEYKDFPILPQPFSLIYHAIQISMYIFRKCMGICQPKDLVDEIDETAIYRVSMIEAESREEYQSKMEDQEQQSTSLAIRDLKNELEAIKTMVRQGQSAVSAPTPVPPEPIPVTSKGSRTRKDAVDIFNRLTRIKPAKVHIDSRRSPYPGSDVKRFPVNDEKVSWFIRFSEYNPVDYTAATVENQTGDLVDPPDIKRLTKKIQFNKVHYQKVDKKTWTIDRTSHHGRYNVVDGIPQNPKGRTGVIGRGSLYRWGPNHAADTVVTRWHRDENNMIVKIEGSPILEFVAIFRITDNEWAIPGGRVKPNERVFETIKREFSEEALANLSGTSEEQAKISQMLTEHFNLGITVYKGYVDDPRNTDNAWIETIAVNYHDPTGQSFSKFPLKTSGSGPTGVGVQWIPIDHNLDLYANHEWIIEKVCYHRDAYNPIKEPKRRDTQVWITGL